MSALAGVPNLRAPAPALDAREHTRVLYEKYGQRVFTFCRGRLRDREEAQDATQTTFIYVMRALERGVVPEFELAWLLKIAFNVCRSTARASQRKTVVHDDTEIEQLADHSDGDGNERVEALREALQTLPESQRHGILLREWQGLSYAEIADEMDLSVGAVETLLFRARRNLARRLEHVRSGVGVIAFPLGSLFSAIKSGVRGVLAKVAVIGAAGSVALVPIAAVDLVEARAQRNDRPRALEPAVAAPAPQAKAAVVAPTARRRAAAEPVRRSAVTPPQRTRSTTPSIVHGRYRVWPGAAQAPTAAAPTETVVAAPAAPAPAAAPTQVVAAPIAVEPPPVLQPVTDPVASLTEQVTDTVDELTAAAGVKLLP